MNNTTNNTKGNEMNWGKVITSLDKAAASKSWTVKTRTLSKFWAITEEMPEAIAQQIIDRALLVEAQVKLM